MVENHQLQRIRIEGFKSIQYLRLDLNNLNVLIGSNGSGKSNLISIFKFIRSIVDEKLQNYVRASDGAEKLLFYGSKTSPSIEIQLYFKPDIYKIELKPTQDDSFYIDREDLLWSSTSDSFVPFLIGEGQKESFLKKETKGDKIYGFTYDSLSSWRVYHFHDTSQSALVKKRGDINDNRFLNEDASNLAAFLYLMKIENLKHYERIVSTIQLVVPMFKNFELRPDPLNKETIRLEWSDKNSEYIFGASALSDGSLRFMCMATLLLQPNLPSLILIDEPELGLHPAAIQILAGLLQKCSKRTQLIISTQSSALISEFSANDIIVVENKAGKSEFNRLDASNLSEWLTDYTLGEIWEKNIVGGRPW